jgi:hypothetical protein
VLAKLSSGQAYIAGTHLCVPNPLSDTPGCRLLLPFCHPL